MDELIEVALDIGADGVDVRANTDVVDEDFMQRMAEEGLEVHVWTVNDAPTARRMRALGVASITTDRPGQLRQELDTE